MSVITVFPFCSALYNKEQGHDSVKTLSISCGIYPRSENVYRRDFPRSLHHDRPCSPESLLRPLDFTRHEIVYAATIFSQSPFDRVARVRL
jgi:hypothetical protein